MNEPVNKWPEAASPNVYGSKSYAVHAAAWAAGMIVVHNRWNGERDWVSPTPRWYAADQIVSVRSNPTATGGTLILTTHAEGEWIPVMDPIGDVILWIGNARRLGR